MTSNNPVVFIYFKYILIKKKSLPQNRLMMTALSTLKITKYGNIVIPCTDDTAITNYLNNPKVKYALHIPDNSPEWSSCSAAVNLNYERNYENMTSQYNSLFNAKVNLRIM